MNQKSLDKGKGIKEIKDNEWIRPSMSKGFKQECCDCGLTHLIKFRIIKTKKRNHIEIKFINLS